jgi:hypothetical protein
MTKPKKETKGIPGKLRCGCRVDVDRATERAWFAHRGPLVECAEHGPQRIVELSGGWLTL